MSPLSTWTTPSYQGLVLCLGLVVLAADVRFFYGARTWHIAWTHWCYAVTLLYFTAALLAVTMPGATPLRDALQPVALACTLSVNLGYWLLLFPMRLSNGSMTLRQLSVVGLVKHGGSLLWLLGDLHIRTCLSPAAAELPGMTAALAGSMLLLSGSYLLFAARRDARTGVMVYGAFFRSKYVQLLFLVTPVSLYGLCEAINLPSLLPSCQAQWVQTSAVMVTPVLALFRWRSDTSLMLSDGKTACTNSTSN